MELLVNGHTVLIDDDDLPLLNYGKCLGVRDGRVRLVQASRTVSIHRLIMKAGPGQCVDHINGNALDNRKANLRICTHAENMRNRKPEKLGRKKIHDHGFKGIIKHSKKNLKKPWYARIETNGQYRISKRFETPAEAAKAYDEMAVQYHGEFARLNFKQKPNQPKQGGH